MFHGSMVALVTPMLTNGEIDEATLLQLIDWHIEQGTTAIILLGTTGESPTITAEERTHLIKKVRAHINGRVALIVGTGSNSTRASIQLTKEAMADGADACLVVTPYYNKPTQEGLFQHFQAIAQNAAIPIILYNVPGRTGVDLLPETIIRLAEFPNIIGVKEATGKIERCSEILAGAQLDIYSGDDATALDLMHAGAKGVISVTTNVAPKLMHDMCAAALEKQWDRAEKINAKLLPLHQNLFLEANPIPVKWALQRMGKIPGGIRLPLTALSSIHHAVIEQALRQAEIVLS